jgi:hypothetical protein
VKQLANSNWQLAKTKTFFTAKVAKGAKESNSFCTFLNLALSSALRLGSFLNFFSVIFLRVPLCPSWLALQFCNSFIDTWINIDTCINNVRLSRKYVARFAGSNVFLLLTHSLRCGLEEYRQLRWLRTSLAQNFLAHQPATDRTLFMQQSIALSSLSLCVLCDLCGKNVFGFG